MIKQHAFPKTKKGIIEYLEVALKSISRNKIDYIDLGSIIKEIIRINKNGTNKHIKKGEKGYERSLCRKFCPLCGEDWKMERKRRR